MPPEQAQNNQPIPDPNAQPPVNPTQPAQLSISQPVRSYEQPTYQNVPQQIQPQVQPQVQLPQAQPQLPPQPQVPSYGMQPNPGQQSVPIVMPTANNLNLSGSAETSKPQWFKLSLGLFALILLAAIVSLVAFIRPAKHATTSSGAGQSANAESVAVQVPSDWKKVDTGLGYSVSAPSGWSAGTSTTADINGLNSQSLPISAGASSSGDTTEPQTSAGPSILAGKEKLDSNSTQAAFTSKVTKLNSDDAATLKAFGVDTSKIKVTSKTLKINGKPWLDVSSDIPSQYSENLYYWDNDHAITLIVTDASKPKVQQLSKTYLYPMAASVTIP